MAQNLFFTFHWFNFYQRKFKSNQPSSWAPPPLQSSPLQLRWIQPKAGRLGARHNWQTLKRENKFSFSSLNENTSGKHWNKNEKKHWNKNEKGSFNHFFCLIFSHTVEVAPSLEARNFSVQKKKKHFHENSRMYPRAQAGTCVSTP